MTYRAKLALIETQVLRACRDAGRERSSVTLIAVSETVAAAAIAAGQLVFGENRVQGNT